MIYQHNQLEKIAIMLKRKKKLKKVILKLAEVDKELDSYRVISSSTDINKGRITAEKHINLCAKIAKEISAPGDNESDLAEWISYNVQKIKAVVDRM